MESFVDIFDIPPTIDEVLCLAAHNGNCVFVRVALREGANVNYKGPLYKGKTALILATDEGHLPVVRELLIAGANKDTTDDLGVSAVYSASHNNHLRILQALIAADADVNIADNNGMSAVYVASQYNHLQILQALIAANADVNITANDGNSPLMVACDRGHVLVVQKLLEAGANKDCTNYEGCSPVSRASGNNHLQVLQALIAVDADVNIALNTGCTPLILASQNNHLDVVKELIHANANVNLSTKDGSTALFMASQNNHLDVVQELIQANANVNLAAKDGYTPLKFACEKGHTDVVKNLLKAGADTEIPQTGTRPLHMACRNGHHAVAKALLDKSCQLQPTDEHGSTPLHHAAVAGRTKLGMLLLENGHQLLIHNNSGETPLDLARKYGQLDFINWMMKNNQVEYNNKNSQVECRQIHEVWVQMSIANMIENPSLALKTIRQGTFDVHLQDMQRQTVLHIAATLGDLDTVQALIDFGCFPEPVSLTGQTPADLALETGHIQVHRFLMEYAQGLKQKGWSQHSKESYKHLTELNRAGRKEDASDLEAQNGIFKLVKSISSLICQGLPLAAPYNISSEPLFMAIQNHNLRILELLFCANAPLYGTIKKYDILQIVWLTQNGTEKQAIMVTRQFEMQLKHELQQIGKEEDADTLLTNGIIGLIDQLQLCPYQTQEEPNWLFYEQLVAKYSKIKPWRASWPIENADALSLSYKSKAHLLIRACLYGATSTAWFMWRSGVNTSLADDNGQLPLLTAIRHQHWDTVRHLISYMGCNPFMKTPGEIEPFKLIPKQTRQELLQIMALSEFNRLNNTLSSAKDRDKKFKLKKTILLFVSLYYTFTEIERKLSWKEIYSYMFELLTRSMYANEPSQDNDFEEKDDKLTWLHQLCQNISKEFEFDIFVNLHKYEQGSLQEVLSCLDQIQMKIIPLSKEKYKLNKNNGNILLTICSSETILIQALEFTCEKKYNLFLHMLVANAGLDPNVILNDVLQTRPLHHAAAEGNIDAVAYLIHACDVNTNVLDRNGNNASHYSYLYGHINTGNYLIENKTQLNQMKNSSMKSPLHLKCAYKDRLKELGIQNMEKKISNELNEKLTFVCEQSNEYELTKLLMDLSMFKKDLIKKTYKDLALDKLVDYNKGEGRLIYNEIVSFIEKVGLYISMNSKYLDGRLIPAGSSADRCRLGCPDESDFNWVLEWEGVEAKLKEIPQSQQLWKGYTHKLILESKNQQINNLLSGSNLLDAFQSAVNEAIPNCLQLEDNRLSIVLPGVKRTGVGMSLTFAWMGSEHKLLLVDVDLVPVIKTERPSDYPHPQLTRDIYESTQSIQETKHTIQIAGNNWEFSADDLHAAYINSIGNGEWRFSQALEENYIMLKLNEDQKNVFLISKYLVSILKAEPWYPEKVKRRFSYFNSTLFKLPAPQGFLIKSSFFKELERVPEYKMWHEQYYLDRIKCIFLHMCRQNSHRDELLHSFLPDSEKIIEAGNLDSGKVPSYFASSSQMQTAGYLAPTIFEKLNQWKIEDFVA